MRTPTLLLLTSIAAVLLPAPALAQPADLVVEAPTIHTLDPAKPTAKAVAVRGDRIVAVADAVDPAWVGPKTRRLKATGSVVPGLWDAHGHLLGLGLAKQRVDLTETASFAQVVERVKAAAAKLPKGSWIQGRGWDQNDWPKEEFAGEFPTHDLLSAATPDHPVVLRRIDGHASLVNALAMKLSGITAETMPPNGGTVFFDPDDREPTGVLVDAAMSLVSDPELNAAQIREALLVAAKECRSKGLVGVHDAGVSLEVLEVYEELYREKELAFRVYAMLRPKAALALGQAPGRKHGGLLTVRAIKRFMDGALGSRGAYLDAPYSDAPKTQGLPQLETQELEAFTREMLAKGWQVCTHAIGDGGTRRVLDAYAAAIGETKDHRLRVEHAQVIGLKDIPRFAQLGVLPSMQPTHCTSDMDWAEARLGPERVKGAYAWRRLLDAGVKHLPLGSDFPVEKADPLLGLYAAIARVTPSGDSPHGAKGWYADQALTMAEALKGFTLDACYAGFMEQDGGSITVGKWADLTLLDRDLMSAAPGEVLKAKVEATFVGGVAGFEAGD